MKALFSLILCLVCLGLFAQPFSLLFDNEPTRNERGKRIQEYQNDYFVASSLVCLSNDNQCFYMHRFTEDGQPKWKKQIDWIDLGNWESFFVKNDTIVMAGHANGTTLPFAQSFLLHRMNTEGDSLDRFEFPVDIYGYDGAFCFGVMEYDNEYYLYGDAGRVSDGIAVGIIFRVSKSGELLQHYEYEGEGTVSHVFDLREHPTLGLVFMDKEEWPIGAQIKPNRNLIQFDPISDTTFKLIYTFDDPVDFFVTTIDVMADSSVVFLYGALGFDLTINLNWISPNGDLLQSFAYDDFLFPGNDRPIFLMTEISKTADNSLLVAGSGAFNYPDPNTPGNLIRRSNGYIMKVDENAEMVWQRYYVRYDGSSLPAQSHLFDAREMSDGSILATGYEEVVRNGQTERDMWLLKLDENGCLIENEDCDEEQFTTAVLDFPPEPEQTKLMLFPNPVFDKLSLYLPSNQKIRLVEVFTINGQCLFSKRGHQDQLDLSSIPSGIYLVQVALEDGGLLIERFVKQ